MSGHEGIVAGWFLKQKTIDTTTARGSLVPTKKKLGNLRQIYNMTFLQSIPFCERVRLGPCFIGAVEFIIHEFISLTLIAQQELFSSSLHIS